MTDNERTEQIQNLSSITGIKYRSTPFCLDDPNDFQEFLTILASTYMDYCHCQNRIRHATATLLVTIRQTDPVSQAALDDGDFDNKELLPLRATSELMRIDTAFGPAIDRAARPLQDVLRILLTSPDSLQEAILGQAYKLDAATAEEMISRAISQINRCGHQFGMEANYERFIAYFKSILDQQPWDGCHDLPQTEGEITHEVPSDLKELLIFCCGQFRCYDGILLETDCVSDMFEEILEHNDPAFLLSCVLDQPDDEFYEELFSAFQDAFMVLHTLSCSAEQALRYILHYLTRMDAYEQKRILGVVIAPTDLTEQKLDEIFTESPNHEVSSDFAAQTERFLEGLRRQL